MGYLLFSQSEKFCLFNMRFLLLCPAALLLLTVRVISAKSESVGSSPSPIRTFPNDIWRRRTTPGPASDESLSLENSKLSPDDKEDLRRVRKLRKEVARAQALLKVINEESTTLKAKIESAQSRMADLVLTRKDLTSKLETVRYAIRERQDELNTKRLGRKKCEPTPLELAIQIGDETRQQLQDKEEEIRPFYSRRYNKLLEELGQLIRKREKELLDNDPNPV